MRVDVGALLDVASRYDTIADAIDGLIGAHLGRLTFDGAVAGRDYAGRGDALRRAVDDVVDQVHVWDRAMREIAATLRTSTDRYVEGDARSATRLG
ncbi:type VII secretion target [Mycolicibacterium sp.]|uniref:type VII secretion target n=1 Tax=Mycolicibacterium sp. TaxID=2320850 RepID=UPI0025F61CA1|nr:type VII secretion target [Mycolicibacterium sp.]